MKLEYRVDEAALLRLAARVGEAWTGLSNPGISIQLHGDLGAGKTTFTRGFLTGLGHEGIVKSPTYTLVEPYAISGIQVYHFDLYRLSDPEELEFTGARDYFNEQAACLVEWPEKATGMLPEPDLDIHLQVADQQRDILFDSGSEEGEQIMLGFKSD